MSRAVRRWAIADLEDLVAHRSDRDLAELLGISHGTLTRLRGSGLDDFEADRLAVRTGRHPANVWPSWFAVIDEQLVCDGWDEDEAGFGRWIVHSGHGDGQEARLAG